MIESDMYSYCASNLCIKGFGDVLEGLKIMRQRQTFMKSIMMFVERLY